MDSIKWIFTFISMAVLCVPVTSQNAIGEWSDHISYSKSRFLTIGGARVFVSNSEAIFYYNRSDNSVSRLTRVQGLTERGISSIEWNHDQKVLVIGYDNGNIDLWSNGSIYNMPDLLNSSVLGNKEINEIVCKEKFAYLCTGVGILEIDLVRREVSSTYNIVVPGESLILNDIAFQGDSIYVAADDGLYSASASATNLGNFSLWNKIELPDGRYLDIESHPDGLYTILRTEEADSLGFRDPDLGWQFVLSSPDARGIFHVGDAMLFLESYGVRIFESGIQSGEFAPNAIEERNFFDLGMTADSTFWITDDREGLIEFTSEGEVLGISLPEGPRSARVFELAFNEGNLWMVTGRVNRPGNWNSQFVQDGFAILSEGEWRSFDWSNSPGLRNDTIFDLVDVAIDPTNREHAYLSSWYGGLVEYSNGEVIEVFDYNNSALQERPEVPGTCHVSDSEFDENGNLWILNGYVAEPLVVYTAGGEWRSFNYNGQLSASSRILTDLIITQQNHKWAAYNGNGIMVYSHGESILNDTDDDAIRLSTQTGRGGMHTNEVLCIEEDLDGEIWVGTTEGITVFFTPGDVFSSNPSDAQRIIIEEGSSFRYLLEAEAVSSIAVDGANRKWIGTYGSGAFLLAEDGQEQILHFTTSNSPLPSNSVEDIEIDAETGEVFIGTSNGIVSYRGDATAGEQQNTCANVYPNPVRENYDGPIAIEGLVRNAVVKITDVRGNLVKELTSNGGQAIWDGTNVDGQRVNTGVYFALASSSLAETTCISKILVVK